MWRSCLQSAGARIRSSSHHRSSSSSHSSSLLPQLRLMDAQRISRSSLSQIFDRSIVNALAGTTSQSHLHVASFTSNAAPAAASASSSSTPAASESTAPPNPASPTQPTPPAAQTPQTTTQTAEPVTSVNATATTTPTPTPVTATPTEAAPAVPSTPSATQTPTPPSPIPADAAAAAVAAQPEVVTHASQSAPAAFNAAAAAAAATGLPPPAVTTPAANVVKPAEAAPTPKQDASALPLPPILSQSPPAGFPLPFAPTHLLWMANGSQSSIADLFLTRPTAAAAAPPAEKAAATASAPVAALPPRPRLVLVVGFVGAFLSLCQTQLPPFASHFADFRKRGVDSIYGVSVNDHAVLKSFAGEMALDFDHMGLIADADATFVRGLNLAMDLSAAGMGIRSKRFVMLVREGFVEEAWVESNPGELTVARAENVLQRLAVLKEIKPAATTTAEKVVAAVQAGISAVSDKIHEQQPAAKQEPTTTTAAPAAAAAQPIATAAPEATSTAAAPAAPAQAAAPEVPLAQATAPVPPIAAAPQQPAATATPIPVVPTAAAASQQVPPPGQA